MIKKYILGSFFLVATLVAQAQQSKFEYDGLADVILSFPERGSGGRILVHGPNNTASINWDGDFTGGTRIGPSFNVGNNGSFKIPEGASFYCRGEDLNHVIAYRREHDNKLIDGPVMLGWSGGALGIKRGVTESMVLKWDENGNVGIGTMTPSERLSVNGKIRAHEIKVETANWPDYVFQPEYELTPLSEVSRFIKENGHLPEVPKASEVEAEGVSLGEMNKILLKKVEELTLHLIEKDEEMKKKDMMMTRVLERLEALEISKSKN